LDTQQGLDATASPTVAQAATRYDVFLCHNSLDKPLVKDVADALQVEAGILFFLDEFSIPASVEFMEFIREEMKKSAACAIFVGANGWGATHLAEARLALEVKAERKDFRIIPVNLPDATPDIWSELFGAGNNPPYNWMRLDGPADDAARAKLIEAVHGRFPVKAAGPEAITPYYIRRQAALWELSGRKDNSLLIGGQLLKTARLQAAGNPKFVSVNAVPAYLDRCAQRERNVLRAIAAAAGCVAVVTAVLAGAAVLQRNEAARQRDVATENARVAQARSLASLAVRSIGEDREDERALLLARQAFLTDKQTGARSFYDVTAALSEVLSTPFLSSTARVPKGASVDRMSPSGTYALLSDKGTVLFGPLVGGNARSATATPVPLKDPIVDFGRTTDELVVVTSKGDVEIRKFADPKRRDRLIAELGHVPSIFVLARNGTVAVALFGDSDIVSLDLAAPNPAKRWKLDTHVDRLALSADGRLLAATDKQGTLRAYAEGVTKAIATFPATDNVNSFDFANGSALVVGERGGRIWTWDPRNKPKVRQQLDQDEARGSIDTIAVSADGRTAATASGAITPGITVWDLESRKQRGRIPGVRSVGRLEFTNDGRFLLSSGISDDEIRFWRLKGSGSGRSTVARDWQPFPLPGRLYSVVRDPKRDEFLVGGDHGVLQRWSPRLEGPPTVLAERRSEALQKTQGLSRFESGGRNYLLTGHVMGVAYSRDGSRFATVDPYGFVVVWAAADADIPVVVQSADVGHPSFSVALSPSGRRLMVGATSNLVVVHDLKTDGTSERKSSVSSDGENTVRVLAFRDEQTVIVGDDSGRLMSWRLDAAAPHAETILSNGPAITSVAFLGESRMIVGRGGQIDLIDTAAPAPSVKTISAGLGQVYATAVSDDGKTLAVGFADGIVRFWMLAQLERQPVLLKLHKDVVRSIAFDITGDRIMSVSDDGTIRSTAIGAEQLGSLACELLWRDLDRTEVASFFTMTTPPVLPTCPHAPTAAKDKAT
jgi:WD40 repeat protein